MPIKKRWGEVEDLHMLTGLPGAPQGLSKEDSVYWFQNKYQYKYDLGRTPVDGKMGPKTRKAVITEYMALDGTSLPQGIKPVPHGCGESFPTDPVSVDEGREDQKSNRRVEIFLFEGKVTPAPPGKSSKPGSQVYWRWRTNLTETHDISSDQLGGIKYHCLEMEETFFNLASAVLIPQIRVTSSSQSPAAPFANGALWDEIETSHPEASSLLRDTVFVPEPFAERDAGLLSLAKALVFSLKYPDRSILVMGHADTSGKPVLNRRLTEARGKAVVALLVGDRQLFSEAVEEFNREEDSATVLRYAARTRGWDCEVPDKNKTATTEEIKGFQIGYNQAKLGEALSVDGDIGPKTRAAWFDLYESDLGFFCWKRHASSSRQP